MLKLPLQLGLVTLAFTSFSSVAAVKVVPFHLSCTSGNFKGEVKGEYFMGSAGSEGVMTKSYKITKYNNQSGGNKANLNLSYSEAPLLGWDNKIKSPDNLYQDGQWRSLSQTQGKFWYAGKKMEIGYEFVFDKSLRDPTCNVYKVIN